MSLSTDLTAQSLLVTVTKWADCDDLRTYFTLAMSKMYKDEVPLYSTLVRIVSDVNAAAMAGESLDPRVLAMRFGEVTQSRLDIERHGAIRLGTATELRTMTRVFALLGLFPVGYYDLSEAGLPMHATCFRPITRRAIQKNPFRVFTSVLRADLIRDEGARHLAQDLLGRRQIFSPELMDLLDATSHQHGRLAAEQSEIFVSETIKTFRWQGSSNATLEEYTRLKSEHPILADVACFGTAHINHLTPRTLDITAAQVSMEELGLQVKERIEGPPLRRCPILLRQTSFLAVEESINFRPGGVRLADGQATSSSPLHAAHTIRGSHRARFGEIEERGAAVTRRGRVLFDQLVDEALVRFNTRVGSVDESQMQARQVYDTLLAEVFEKYPDNWDDLRREKLVYFTYRCVARGAALASTVDREFVGQSASSDTQSDTSPRMSLESLLQSGIIEAVPITYEDFLPLSAVGIFRSNLDLMGQGGGRTSGSPDPVGMEMDMGARILDPDFLYRFMEEKSLMVCSTQLGVKIV